MRRRIITLCIIAPFCAALFAYPRWSSNALDASLPQPQRRRQQRRTTRPSAAALSRDYSRFSHASPSHRQQSCNACHDAPTPNWRAARGFPDVADYPSHDSCVRCHRQQFFTGARPPLCTICHTRVSPKEDARYAFPKPAPPSQFTVEFPHDKHQDVIASLRPRRRETGPALLFARASLAFSSQSGDAARKKYNNCAICHETDEREPVAPPAGWPDGFVPAPMSFKTVPQTHASCFNCHWKSQAPTKEDCAGCHKLSAAPRTTPEWYSRISVKFTHAREQHTAECTTCHINITRASTLRGLQPDVPVTACAACHKTSTDRTVATIETELEQRRKNAAFTCTKCHTSELGRKSAPPSHYALFSD